MIALHRLIFHPFPEMFNQNQRVFLILPLYFGVGSTAGLRISARSEGAKNLSWLLNQRQNSLGVTKSTSVATRHVPRPFIVIKNPARGSVWVLEDGVQGQIKRSLAAIQDVGRPINDLFADGRESMEES